MSENNNSVSASALPQNLDLTALSRDQLELLSRAIEDEKLASEQRHREQTRKKIEAVLAEAGMSVDDLPVLFSIAGRSQKPRPAYRNPAKPAQTWTGKGRKPGWVEKHLKAGGKIEDLRAK